jgi:hypothetical protein
MLKSKNIILNSKKLVKRDEFLNLSQILLTFTTYAIDFLGGTLFI